MNLFELFVKIGVDDQASGKLSNLSNSLGKGLATAAKIGTAAVTAAATAITTLTTAAVNNYAQYEQLTGGVKTLFNETDLTLQEYAASVGKSVNEVAKEWSDMTSGGRKVMVNASNAFKTAGMSANQYMETVTSFSASLLQSLGGDTDAAARMADMAITDMADNANKMGSDLSTLQTAYAGFAKGQFMLLDNLKLGYQGTKEDMKRLLADAQAISGIKYDISSYADIVDAIHVIQTEMGIAGATAAEAGTTIEGSVNSMKAAWTNLITGLADGNADIGVLIDNLVTTIVGDGTENNLGVFGNIMPAVKRALNGASELVQVLLPKIVQEIPSIINENLPILAEAAVGIIESLVDGISNSLDSLMPVIVDVVVYIANSLVKQLPKIVKLGLNLIVALAKGIAQSIPKLLPTIVKVVTEIVAMILDPSMISELLDASLQIIMALADGLIDSIPQLVQAMATVMEGLVAFILNPANTLKIAEAGINLIISLGAAIVKSIPILIQYWGNVISSIYTSFEQTNWSELGASLVDSIKSGISSKWSGIIEWFNGIWESLFGNRNVNVSVTKTPIKSVGGRGGIFATAIDGSHALGLDYVPFDGYVAELHKGERVLTASEARGYGGTSIGNININIDGAKYSDEQSLASAIALEIQNMTDRRAAVYA